MLLWPFNKYPGTDYETFNWEWILKTVKEYTAKVDDFIEDINDTWNTFRNWVSHEIANMHRDFAIYVNATEGALNSGAIADGAITAQKINSALITTLTNAYATPEDYGAVGDGVADDTAACQAAINSGKKWVVFANKYKITSPLTWNTPTSAPYDLFITGYGYIRSIDCPTFVFTGVSNLNIENLYLDTDREGVVLNTDDREAVYNHFKNLFIYNHNAANYNGIVYHCTNHFLNESTIEGCKCWNFNYGFEFTNDSNTECNDHKIIDCNAETCRQGFAKMHNCNNMQFFYNRHQEPLVNMFETTGTNYGLLIVGGRLMNQTGGAQRFSANTYGMFVGSYRDDITGNLTPGAIVKISEGKLIRQEDVYSFNSYVKISEDITLPTKPTNIERELFANAATGSTVNITLDPQYYGGAGKINYIQFYVGSYSATYNIIYGSQTLTIPPSGNTGHHFLELQFSNANNNTKEWYVSEKKRTITF